MFQKNLFPLCCLWYRQNPTGAAAMSFSFLLESNDFLGLLEASGDSVKGRRKKNG